MQVVGASSAARKAKATGPAGNAFLKARPLENLRVLTLNMNTGHGAMGRFRDAVPKEKLVENLEGVAGIIAESGADIACLQEVDFRWEGTHEINQAEWLREKTGLPHLFYHAHHRSIVPRWIRDRTRAPAGVVLNRDMGTAILSRFPLSGKRAYDFGQDATCSRLLNYLARLLHESKGYTMVETEAAGRRFGVLNTHLLNDIVFEIFNFLGKLSKSLGRQVRGEIFARVWQVEKLLEHVREFLRARGLPLIIAGDFNTVPRESNLLFSSSKNGDPDDYRRDISPYLLREAGLFRTIPALFGRGTPESIAPYNTYPSIEPDRPLDYVFATREFEFVDYRVLPREVSDHRAVLATLRLA